MTETSVDEQRDVGKRRPLNRWMVALLLVSAMAAGGYLRFTGLDWDKGQHLHPDERFLTMVSSAISPVESLGEYFDTAHSSLNPHNRGHTFYVYGTLPLFMTRYLGEWLGLATYGDIHLVGRALSASVDLLVVLLVFLAAERLYDGRVGLLAAVSYAMLVLPLQQSRFFTVDTFASFFMMLAFYFAAVVVAGSDHRSSADGERVAPNGQQVASGRAIVLFGLASGMAIASKINAAPIVIILPLAVGLHVLRLTPEEKRRQAPRLVGYLVLSALVSFLIFRVFQPYAFTGPGLLGVAPNPAWLESLKALRAQTSGDVDFPPALQWARRPVTFSWQNMVLWGLGLPMGILAWSSFAVMAWRMYRGEWQKHVLIWGWTAAYFTWQSLQWNSTLRYQLPIYPLLAMIAAWGLVAWNDRRPARGDRGAGGPGWRTESVHCRPLSTVSTRPHRWSAVALGGVVLLSTAAWACAFVGIYPREHTRIAASRWLLQEMPGPVTLLIEGGDGVYRQPLPFASHAAVQADQPRDLPFEAHASGRLSQIQLPHVVDQRASRTPTTVSVEVAETFGEDSARYEPGEQTLRADLYADLQSAPLATGTIRAGFSPQDDPRGEAYQLVLGHPVTVEEGSRYVLRFTLEDGPGALTFTGAAAANESSWDDGLPLRVDGYDPYGGIYQGGLNFEMYWDDNEDKYERFVSTLDQADYILISSSRQWGTTTRLPERYPLTSEYFRRLLGCPPERSIEWCYNVAEAGTFRGDLGFDLVRVFVSNPEVAGLSVNDQFAEEAFTVYDHPKVFVFKKADHYDPARARDILGAVDLSQVVHLTPKQAESYPGNLLLPPQRLVEQRRGGTWSAIFDYEAFQNKNPLASIVIWFLAVSILGWVSYPFVRYALPGLGDRGYPLARIVGLLLLAYLAWMAGSLRAPFSRVTIGAAFGLIALLGAVLAYRQRVELRAEWRERRGYILLAEVLFLAFFVLGLLVRFDNPDLWHPWKGGEKPMDFSYFNAVLKSTSFPPYDPWFAGGYINYYYYGFVIVGVLVKLLGIVPSIAYNLILPTLFAMIAMGAFSAAWNLVWRDRVSAVSEELSVTTRQTSNGNRESSIESRQSRVSARGSPLTARPALTAGLAAALLMALLGNLGTLRMIVKGLASIAAPTGSLAGAGFFSRLWWTVEGLFKALTGSSLPYGVDEWYWNPSRVIAAEHGSPITEFPYYSFLYGDLHAHLIALPVALLVISWALSVVLSRACMRDGRRSPRQAAASLFLGGLTIGALYPVNLSDIYTYLPLGALALALAIWFHGEARARPPEAGRRPLLLGAAVIALIVLAIFLYQPYRHWYGQGYSEVGLWRGTRTPLSDYLTHWGLFIFIFGGWLVHESIDWMASTPVSALRRLRPFASVIWALLALLAGVILFLGINRYPEGIPPEVNLPVGWGVHVVWLALPMAAWAGVLLLRPGISAARRFVLLLLGTGLMLTLMVEVVVVSGDLGRMNTVFKFYLQAWTLFSVAGAVVFTWLLCSLPRWDGRWRVLWSVSAVLLVAGAALYPLKATPARTRDRMAPEAPHTLDGMTFMRYATYFDLDTEMDLSQDYNAIRWMQDHIVGSPVIVEGQLPEYRWSMRYTVYTGLPGVLGWNWHQRQQRSLTPDRWVWDRVKSIDSFYQTTDVERAAAFLQHYDVTYIVLGQLERARYAGEGLEKFESHNGMLWNAVYRDRDTVIYEVIADRR